MCGCDKDEGVTARFTRIQRDTGNVLVYNDAQEQPLFLDEIGRSKEAESHAAHVVSALSIHR